jgi:hypothetical protein
MNRSRSWRRAQAERMKRRVRDYHSGYARGGPRQLGRVARTRQACSCWMCGNPRRFTGELTLQERREGQVDEV